MELMAQQFNDINFDPDAPQGLHIDPTVPIKTQQRPAKNKIDRETAKRRIRRMLGKHFPV